MGVSAKDDASIEGVVQLPPPTVVRALNQRYGTNVEGPLTPSNPPAAVVYLEGNFSGRAKPRSHARHGTRFGFALFSKNRFGRTLSARSSPRRSLHGQGLDQRGERARTRNRPEERRAPATRFSREVTAAISA